MKGRQVGSQGVEGVAVTDEDHALARRRFEEYIRKTKDLEPFSYSPEDVIKTLPLDGGTVWPCGETRFNHVVNGTCKNGVIVNERCGKEMSNGKICHRKFGHGANCLSEEYIEKNKKSSRERRKRAREVDKRNG